MASNGKGESSPGFTDKVEAETTVVLGASEIPILLRRIRRLETDRHVENMRQTKRDVPLNDRYYTTGYSSTRIRETDGEYQIDLKDKIDVPDGDDVLRIRRERTGMRTEHEIDQDIVPILEHNSIGIREIEKERTEFLIQDDRFGKMYLMIDGIRRAALQKMGRGRHKLKIPLGGERFSLEIEMSRGIKKFSKTEATAAIGYYLDALDFHGRGEALSVRKRLLRILMEERTAREIFSLDDAEKALRIVTRALCENDDEETLKKRLEELNILLPLS